MISKNIGAKENFENDGDDEDDEMDDSEDGDDEEDDDEHEDDDDSEAGTLAADEFVEEMLEDFDIDEGGEKQVAKALESLLRRWDAGVNWSFVLFNL